MKYFYQNLERIARGDWWLWNVTAPAEAFTGRWSDDVELISNLLSFDLHGYATSKTNGNVTSETIESIAMEHCIFKYIKRMPVEVFLTLYRERDQRSDLLWQQRYANAAIAQTRAMIKETARLLSFYGRR